MRFGSLRLVCLSLLVATCLVSAACSDALGASLASLTLTIDGSADPPGDRLDLSLAFAKGEPPLVIEVRAVFMSDEIESGVEQVQVRGERNRDRNGLFLLTQTVDPKPEQTSVQAKVVVPYADLDLDPGNYRIAYEVRGIQGKSIAFVQPTRLTEVEVAVKPQAGLELARHELRGGIDERKVEALFAEDGKLVKRPVTIRRPTATPRTIVERHKVDIAGGFLRSEIEDVARGGEPSPPHVPLDEFEPRQKRQVFFATNRNLVEGQKTKSFGPELSSDVRFGTCTVNIPITSHSAGQLELPLLNWWKSHDPEKYFFIESTEIAPWDKLRGRILENDRLLFVHGFNNDFNDVVMRTAQLHHDLKFPGHSMVFSWPADGTPTKKGEKGRSSLETAYSQAEERLDATADALVQVLSRISRSKNSDGSSRLHIVAHSLGCRVLLTALARWQTAGAASSDSSRPIATIVLMAPDVDIPTFERCIPALLRSTDMLTYYYSGVDMALLASQRVHGGVAPVGLMPFFSLEVDTVNADNANFASLLNLGHLYYASSIPVLADLQMQFNLGYRPDKRQPPLVPMDVPKGLSHWSFLIAVPEQPSDAQP